MQIISNDCFGSFLIKKLNLPFENPFVWVRIPLKDFTNLINLFPNLNYDDVEISLNRDYKKEFKLWPCDALSPVITCNSIRFFFNHYKYNANDKTPRKQIPDVFYYRNYEYALEKWNERSKRITNEKPIIILHHNDLQNDKNVEVYKIINECKEKDYKLIVISNLPIKSEEKMLSIYCSDVSNLGVKDCVDRYFNQIKSFINEQ